MHIFTKLTTGELLRTGNFHLKAKTCHYISHD